MPDKKKNNERAEALINTMSCARWLVGQFEQIGCGTLAGFFQHAVDDADAWIQTKAVDGELPREAASPIKAREAMMLHNLLVKYSSFDPEVRERFLAEMNEGLDRKNTSPAQKGKKYAG